MTCCCSLPPSACQYCSINAINFPKFVKVVPSDTEMQINIIIHEKILREPDISEALGVHVEE